MLSAGLMGRVPLDSSWTTGQPRFAAVWGGSCDGEGATVNRCEGGSLWVQLADADGDSRGACYRSSHVKGVR